MPLPARVLFICTGNTCRSPMAETLFRQLAAGRGDGNRVRVASAGLFASEGSPASSPAVALLATEGLDLSAHRARLLTQAMVDDADLIVTMTRNHRDDLTLRFLRAKDKTHQLGELGGRRADIKDPMGGSEADYAACREEIARSLDQAYDRIMELSGARPQTKPRRGLGWRKRRS